MVQSAQLHDLLSYLHRELDDVVRTAHEDPNSPTREMRIDRAAWQRLQMLQMQLGRYMRQITEP
jgi:hypothetical protein